MNNSHSFYHGPIYTLYDPYVVYLNVLIKRINHYLQNTYQVDLLSMSLEKV